MKRVEACERWDKFVSAFNSLGAETYGMTPEAASLLPYAAAEYERDSKKGYRPLQSGVPKPAVVSNGEKMINIESDYPGKFWKIDLNLQRAQITQEGVDYVNAHHDVFFILLGE